MTIEPTVCYTRAKRPAWPPAAPATVFIGGFVSPTGSSAAAVGGSSSALKGPFHDENSTCVPGFRLLPVVGRLPQRANRFAGQPCWRGSFFQALVKDARTRIKEISAANFRALRKEDPTLVVVDVREDNEWNQRRIAGAIHVGRGVRNSLSNPKCLERRRPSSSTARAADDPRLRRMSSGRWATRTSPRWLAAWRLMKRPACPWTARVHRNRQGDDAVG